jgi:phage baseplate assembly protein V
MQADNARRLEQLIRLGTIAEVDHAKALCRVQCGDLQSDWLPWLERRAGKTRTWNPPTAGEQCLWVSPSGNTDGGGCVVVGLYSANAPSTDKNETLIAFPDGATTRYNHATSALGVAGIKTATVQAAEHVTVDSPEGTFTGNVTIEGNLTVKGMATVEQLLTYLAGMAGQGGAGGGTKISGPITHADGDLASNGIVLHTHKHGGTQPGSGTTGAPA